MRRAITLRIDVCGTRVSPGATKTGCALGAGATLGAGAAAGAAVGLACSTSALTMRPLGPLPLSRERSIPFSAAMRLGSGEAKMRPPLGAAAGLGGGGAGVGDAGAGAAAFGAAGLGADIGAGAAPAGNAVSPSSSRMAMTAFTFTPSAPSGTTIWPILPSSTASTSIVALSVSISQMTWPALTVSPTLTCHFASLPSVMVGDSAGIRMLMDMARALESAIADRAGGLDDVVGLRQGDALEIGGIGQRHVEPMHAHDRGIEPIESLFH